MTVSSEVSKSVYSGDGSTYVWPITFNVSGITSSEVKVYKTDTSGNSSLISTGYEVDLTALTVTYPTLASGLTRVQSGEQVVLVRELYLTQETDYKNQGSLPAETIEEGSDRVVMMVQQLQEQIDRSIKSDISLDESDLEAINLAASESADEAAASAVEAESSANAAAASAVTASAAADTMTAAAAIMILDGGGDVLTVGQQLDVLIPFTCTLTGWEILADTSGAIKIDVWKDTYANFPPANDDSICNGHEPEIAASGVKAQDTDISDWSDVEVAENDIIRINVDSVTDITRCTLILHFER